MDEHDQVLPVVQEELEVSKRSVPREHVRLTTKVTEREERVDVALEQEQLDIKHVPIERLVDAASGPRQQGDTWIFPVYEEILVVEKRLMLREEVHVKRSRREAQRSENVTLRREEVEVVRTALNDPPDNNH